MRRDAIRALDIDDRARGVPVSVEINVDLPLDTAHDATS